MRPIKFVVLIVVVMAGLYYWNNPDKLPVSLKSIVSKVEKKAAPTIKTFSMDSYFAMTEGSPSANFSLKDITVAKGDTVRIKIKNTKGTHDFVIDEYSIKEETPEGTETVIEFTADKAGEFKYYCSKYNHRTLGQEGILKVI